MVIGSYKGNSCQTWQRALEDFAWLQRQFLSQLHILKVHFLKKCLKLYFDWRLGKDYTCILKTTKNSSYTS